MVVLGDSKLIIDFCNRKCRPSRKFLPQVTQARGIAKALPTKVEFRHVYRANNALADWLTNVARERTGDLDVTPSLRARAPELTFLSDPPWGAKEAARAEGVGL